MSPLILPPIKPSHYRPDIDGLRAIAIVSVVIFHTFPSQLPGGFVGVDVFFVISGYLISSIIFRSLEKGSFSFLDFYARRIRRIFPALSFLLIGVILLGALFLTPEEFKNLGKQAIYASAFGENIFLIRHSGGYWDTATEMKPLMHLWTLAVEEQYYIFYPLLCWVLWKLKKNVLPALCALWLISFGLDLYQSQTTPIIAFFSLHTRFWELCTGCILAALVNPNMTSVRLVQHITSKLRKEKTRESGRGKQNILNFFYNNLNLLGSLAGLVLISAGILFATGDSKLRPLLILLPVTGTLLLVIFRDSWINKNILGSTPFVFIGLISYTWYLWHWPLLSISRNLNGGNLPDYRTCFLLLLIGLALSLFSYFVIETPIRKKAITKKLTISLSICVFCCTLLGLVVQSLDGFPGRLGDKAAAALSSKNTFPKQNKYAKAKYDCPDDLEFCWAQDNSQPTIALIGDSHAHHLAFGLQKNLSEPLLLLGQPGTPPVRGLISLSHERRSSKPLMDRALDIVNNDKNIQTVILSARWDLFVNSKKGTYQVLGHDNSDNLITLEYLLSKSISELIKNKKNVILVLDVPQIPVNPKDCIKSRPFQEAAGICDFPESKKKVDDKKIIEMIKRLAKQYPPIRIMDASRAFCRQGVCTIGDGKSIYYHDDNHLTDKGSDLVAKQLLMQDGLKKKITSI